MYTKEKNNGRLLNFVLGIIAIIIIIFVIIWIINKGHTASRNTKMFNNNLNTMQETATNYFNRNLPENIGESYKVSLKEMYALGLSDKLYYGNTACDANESYILVTKTGENEYKFTSMLVCGDKKDSKIETINKNGGKTNTNTVDNTNTTIDNTTTNTNTNTNTNKNTTKNNTSCPSSCGGSGSVNCSITNDESHCRYTYEYEYVQKTYGCPEGYAMTNDGRCAKTTNVTINATEVHGKTVVPAKKTNDTTQRVYTPTLKEEGTETLYCKNGELKNGKCYEYETILIKYNSTYSCPKGYDKSGTGANTKCTKTDVESTKYIRDYTPWGNPDRVFDSSTKIAIYEYELEKLIQTGSTCKTLFGTTSCIYSYEHYSRSYTYSCPKGFDKSGSGVNTKCTKTTVKTADPIVEMQVVQSCPDGYTLGTDKCYKTSNPSKYTTGTRYYCPTDYITEGTGANTKCYKNVKITGEYYCEDANATLTNDHKCVIEKPVTYSCPSDYSISGNKCYKTTNEYTSMIVTGSHYIYSTATSVEGYVRTGRYNYTYDCTYDNK